jgi:hypothetical protein
MISACHVIKHRFAPRFWIYMACYDVASTIHQTLPRPRGVVVLDILILDVAAQIEVESKD